MNLKVTCDPQTYAKYSWARLFLIGFWAATDDGKGDVNLALLAPCLLYYILTCDNPIGLKEMKKKKNDFKIKLQKNIFFFLLLH